MKRKSLVLLGPARRTEHADDAAEEAANHAGDEADFVHRGGEHGLPENREEEDAGEQTAHESENAAARTAEVAVFVRRSMLAAEEAEGRPVADPEGGEGSDDTDKESGGLDHDFVFLLDLAVARRFSRESGKCPTRETERTRRRGHDCPSTGIEEITLPLPSGTPHPCPPRERSKGCKLKENLDFPRA